MATAYGRTGRAGMRSGAVGHPRVTRPRFQYRIHGSRPCNPGNPPLFMRRRKRKERTTRGKHDRKTPGCPGCPGFRSNSENLPDHMPGFDPGSRFIYGAKERNSPQAQERVRRKDVIVQHLTERHAPKVNSRSLPSAPPIPINDRPQRISPRRQTREVDLWQKNSFVDLSRSLACTS